MPTPRHHPRGALVAPALVVLTALAACASGDDGSPGAVPTRAGFDTTAPAATSVAPTSPSVATPTAPDPTTGPPDLPVTEPERTTSTTIVDDRLVTAATSDLAEQLGIHPSAVEIVAIEATTWRDAALGCPSSGVTYDPEPVDGYLLVLAVDGVEYRYHGAAGEVARRCLYLD